MALILTPVVTGYVLLLVFGQTASVGHPLMMPLVSFSVSTYDAHDPFGDRGGDPKLEEAATTIGARAIRVFLTGTMPLLAAGLVAGWFGFRQSYERIWGNNHLCGKDTGPDANAAIGDASAVWDSSPVYFYLWFCADAVRMDGVGALCGVSANDIFLDLNHSVGDVNLALAARFCLL